MALSKLGIMRLFNSFTPEQGRIINNLISKIDEIKKKHDVAKKLEYQAKEDAFIELDIMIESARVRLDEFFATFKI